MIAVSSNRSFCGWTAASNSGSGAVLAGSQRRRKYLNALTSASRKGMSVKSRVKGSLDVDEDDDEVGRSLLLADDVALG